MGAAPKDNQILAEDVLRRFPAHDRYLVGVSGGRDSVALLHALVRREYRRLIVCHLEHGLRGRSGRADAAFVARLAKENGLQYEAASAKVRELAKQGKHSVETAARAARYDFFSEVARRRRCPRIFLGHHADDLVETFLMNLFRGAGGEGLRSMQAVSRQGNLTIIRPMLSVWRDEIDRYVASHDLKFREDPTNRSLQQTRNRFRHRIIPLLEKEFGREIRKSVWRAATIAAGEEELLASMMPAISPELSVADLHKQPTALQRRIIRAWLRTHHVSNIDFQLIERVRGLVDPAGATAKTNLPGDRHVRRRAKKIFLEEKGE